MCKKLLCLMAVLIVALASSQALATNWFGGWVDDDFLNGGNWTGGDPADQDNVINQGHTVEFTNPGDPYYVNSLQLGDGTDNMNTLNANSGILGMNANLVIGGLWTAGNGTVNMYGGELQPATIYQGHNAGVYGEINLYAGRIYAWSLYQMGGYGGTSLLNLEGGLMEGTQIVMNSGSQIVITDGVLKMNGDWGTPVANVTQYIADGWIAAGAGLSLQTELINGGAGIQVTAIPEPASIALLGLGGLLLSRKKH